LSLILSVINAVLQSMTGLNQADKSKDETE
jgi:hypothetical protein